MYFNGDGVPQDDKEAVKWYRKGGGKRIGGTGFPKAGANGGGWFLQHADHYTTKAKEANASLTQKMTPEQIARAQDLSMELYKKINAAK